MKRDTRNNLLLILLAILCIIGVCLFVNNLILYCVIIISLIIIDFVSIVAFINSDKNEDEIFENNVNGILRLYESVLVKSKNFPDLIDKNIIRIESIEDLINAQVEIRKPIYYVKQIQSCSFILIDGDEALVYIIKKDKDSVAALDIIINDVELLKKQKNNRKKSKEEDLLDDIDKTTVIKIDKDKSFKVSPIRKNNKKKSDKEA